MIKLITNVHTRCKFAKYIKYKNEENLHINLDNNYKDRILDC